MNTENNKREQLVTIETAKLAKQKGFNWTCNRLFHKDQLLDDIEENNNKLNEKDIISAPTQTCLQSWLRKEHSINLYVIPLESRHRPDIEGYQFIIHETATKQGLWSSWKEALENGLLDGLKQAKK